MVALWGLTRAQDAALLRVFAPAALSPLSPSEAETDELQLRFSSVEPPSVQNDVVTIGSRQAADGVTVKLAVSHALAQSTMLAHYERRVTESVRSTAHIPRDLALTGSVDMTRRDILKLIGKLFSMKAEVNILSPLLDTPEVFWTAPDALQTIYKSLCVYLELDARVAVVNARLNVVEDMLQMLQNTIYAKHSQKLEMVVILLILVECVPSPLDASLACTHVRCFQGHCWRAAVRRDDWHSMRPLCGGSERARARSRASERVERGRRWSRACKATSTLQHPAAACARGRLPRCLWSSRLGGGRWTGRHCAYAWTV